MQVSFDREDKVRMSPEARLHTTVVLLTNPRFEPFAATWQLKTRVWCIAEEHGDTFFIFNKYKVYGDQGIKCPKMTHSPPTESYK